MSKAKGGNKGQIVRYQSKKNKFEIVCQNGAPLKYRNGKTSVNNALMADQIFTNVTKGDIANPDVLKDVFGTDNINECCKIILENGEIQYTAQERKAFITEKTREIVYYLTKNYVDPKTKLPHPSVRIEQAMKKAKFVVDPNIDARNQAEQLLKKITGKQLMFAKAVLLTANLTIKHAHVNQCQNIISKNSTIINQEWTAEGCIFTLELTQGDMDTLIVALNKPTNGNYDFELNNDGSKPKVNKLDKKLKYKENKKKKRKERKDKKNPIKNQGNDEQKSNNKKKKKKQK